MSQTINLDSQEAKEMLRRSLLTVKPCANPEHRDLGYTQLVFRLDEGDNPQPRFANGRVLFFGCVGCNHERWASMMPNCPTDHRPYRSWSMEKARCWACNQESDGTSINSI